MRLRFLLLFNIIYSLSFSQIRRDLNDSSSITGIYRIQLKECYNNKDELFYSTFFEGDINISSSGSSFVAEKVKTNRPYFSIIKNGAAYQINDKSEMFTQEGFFTADLFRGEEIKLKLSSKDRDHIGWYSVYTLRRINAKELYKSISQGTGFFISSSGHILTNYHVIANNRVVKVNIANKEHDCEIVFKNEIDDVAIIRVKDSLLKCTPIPLSLKNIEVGDDVIVLGFPLVSTLGRELKLSSGIVNSIKGFQDDSRYFQLSAPIDPGNSGGPVLNKMGFLVGLITAKYASATNVGYALGISNVLKNIPDNIEIQTEQSAQMLLKSGIYSKYKNSIVIIRSYSL